MWWGSGEEDRLAIYGEDPRSPGRRASGSAQTPTADPWRGAWFYVGRGGGHQRESHGREWRRCSLGGSEEVVAV
jgi:hypothetical protein